MRKGVTVLLLGLLLCGAGFGSFYYLGTAHCRAMMRQPQPELAWLKEEFRLSDAEFAQITQLHEAYLPRCHERCRRIEEVNAQLRELLGRSASVTPEIQALLSQRARMEADCEAEMLQHFLEVSRTMPPEQGRRYLAWVQAQSSLRGQGMEQRHHMNMDKMGGHVDGGHQM